MASMPGLAPVSAMVAWPCARRGMPGMPSLTGYLGVLRVAAFDRLVRPVMPGLAIRALAAPIWEAVRVFGHRCLTSLERRSSFIRPRLVHQRRGGRNQDQEAGHGVT